MNKYIGVKLIDAEPAICCNKNFFKSMEEAMEYRNETYKNTSKVYDIEDGYKVVYPDGYTSFSPKDVFESAYFQLGDEKGKCITSEDVDNFCVSGKGIKLGDKTTVVLDSTITGFDTVGTSACVSPANYNQEIGERIAREEIKDKIWGHLGFVLQWAINGIKNK